MKLKQVIIATTVFFGVVCGVIILDKKDQYSPEEVKMEIAKHADLFAGSSPTCTITGSASPKRGSPSAIQWVIDSYHAFLANRQIPVSGYLYRKSGTDNLSFIFLHEKYKRIHEVEIEPTNGAMQDALDLQSKLVKAFPELTCKIIGGNH